MQSARGSQRKSTYSYLGRRQGIWKGFPQDVTLRLKEMEGGSNECGADKSTCKGPEARERTAVWAIAAMFSKVGI